jgi:hypothetical protein
VRGRTGLIEATDPEAPIVATFRELRSVVDAADRYSRQSHAERRCRRSSRRPWGRRVGCHAAAATALRTAPPVECCDPEQPSRGEHDSAGLRDSRARHLRRVEEHQLRRPALAVRP